MQKPTDSTGLAFAHETEVHARIVQYKHMGAWHTVVLSPVGDFVSYF